MVDLVMSTWPFVWITLLALSVRRHRQHIRSLRRSLPGLVDTWPMRCECCGFQLKDSRVLVCAEHREYPDGRVKVIMRAWHSDKPRCSAACATDDLVMDTYLNGGRP